MEKPLPNIDQDNEAFCEGLKRPQISALALQEMRRSYWPKAYCQNHDNEPFAANMGWAESSGRGKIFAFNRHHMAFHPGFKDEIPYVYALIELDEGPLISSTLVGDNACRGMSTTSARRSRSSTRIIRRKDLRCRASASSIERREPRDWRAWQAMTRCGASDRGPAAAARRSLSSASPPKGGAGAKILQSATQRFGFAGPTLAGQSAAPTRSPGSAATNRSRTCPSVPDCVVVAVPAEAVLDVLREAAAAGHRERLRRLRRLCRCGKRRGARAAGDDWSRSRAQPTWRVAGPELHGYRESRTIASPRPWRIFPARPISGGISLVSQSGGLLNAFAELTANRGIGVNYLVSSGNEAVLEMADYIDFLADDPATKVIACIMEGAKDGRRFRAAIERAARIKPIVVLKLGRSEFGQRATLAHTGTLAGRHEAFAALFRQNGVALVDSIDALVETAALLRPARRCRKAIAS